MLCFLGELLYSLLKKVEGRRLKAEEKKGLKVEGRRLCL